MYRERERVVFLALQKILCSAHHVLGNINKTNVSDFE